MNVEPSTGRRPANVLFVIKNLQKGGTETQLLRMASALDRTRFLPRICLVSPENHFRAVDPGCAVTVLERAGGDVTSALARHIDNEAPDLIHSFRDVVNVAVHDALRLSKHQPRLLMSVRGRPIYPHHLLRYRKMAERCFRITVNSAGVASTLRRWGRVPESKLAITPNLIDAARWRPPAMDERHAARRALGLAADAFVVVCPARMAWVKNQAGLVLALRILRRRGVLPAGTVVLLPGRVRDRSHAWLVAGLAGPLARAGIIRQPGDIGDLAPYYHAADLLVLPSLAEGMPNVVLEAQLCGLPAIVTQQANRDAIVLDGQTGWVVGTGNPWALARAIEEAAVLLALQRRHMGDAGRARVLAHFGAEVALDRLQRLYAEALGLADEPAAAAAI